jgi:chromosome segregation ATPase
MTNYEQSTSWSETTHQIIDGSPKIMASVFMEMGMIAAQNKNTVEDLRYTIEKLEHDKRLLNDQMEGLKASVRKAQEVNTESGHRLEKFKDQFYILEKQLTHNIEQLIVRDVIIDQLAAKFPLSRTDKAKITKLREVVAKEYSCGQAYDKSKLKVSGEDCTVSTRVRDTSKLYEA